MSSPCGPNAIYFHPNFCSKLSFQRNSSASIPSFREFAGLICRGFAHLCQKLLQPRLETLDFSLDSSASTQTNQRVPRPGPTFVFPAGLLPHFHRFRYPESIRSPGVGMAEPCFIKQDSNAKVCGVHKVPLVQHQSSEEPGTAGLGTFIFFVCPVSGAVVRETPARSKGVDQPPDSRPI